ncbi:MAG: SCO family protein [Xanthomonadales bacterium]|nr:SCO family protein [Xanthomonadales bacterium]
MRRCVLGLLLAATVGGVGAADVLPGDSLYQLRLPLTDQRGTARALDATRGEVTVVTMFYASCPYMCPLIIDTLKLTEARLDEAKRAHLRVLMVSLDAVNDTPDRLMALAGKRKLDAARWTLARTDAAHVRELATALGIRYRDLGNGDFNHSSMLVLLDREGRVLARTETMGKVDAAFLAAVDGALASP